MHLGWDVVSVAAGGVDTPIRPVQVEGTYTPPAYLLADSSGRLHTAGVERQRPDLGMAIADVRDILGHPQIVIAGATWPAELVFRARMYNPLAAVGEYLRGRPDVVALPYPDGWPDEKIDIYVEMVEQLDVVVEPLPESVALSGYVRALGLVRAPDERAPRGNGATGVYSDGRTMLVVAVHGDDDQPTESVDVAVTAEAMRDARSADNVVIEVMAAARAIGADTSTVLLCGNVCFNEALRYAFQNHLGHRLRVADHPMHALVLGATHLLVTDSESAEPEPAAPRHDSQPPEMVRRPADPVPPSAAPPPPVEPRTPPAVTYGPGYPTSPPEPAPSEEPTTRVTREEMSRGLPPHLAEFGSRFTRPPETRKSSRRRDSRRPHPARPIRRRIRHARTGGRTRPERKRTTSPVPARAPAGTRSRTTSSARTPWSAWSRCWRWPSRPTRTASNWRVRSTRRHARSPRVWVSNAAPESRTRAARTPDAPSRTPTTCGSWFPGRPVLAIRVRRS